MAFRWLIEVTVYLTFSTETLKLFGTSASTEKVAKLGACKLKSDQLTLKCNQCLCSSHKF